MTPNHLNRRQFVKTAAVGAGAFALMPTSRVLGANEDIRLALIGLGGRMGGLNRSFSKIPGVRIVALCDPDQEHIAKFAEYHPQAFTSQDVRDVLDRDDVDAIVCAAPNHWHALITIWACQAGKHVYMEKPVSHNIEEGVRMTAAARKYNRIVSSGFQNRSDTGLIPFYEKLHAGTYGKVVQARVLCSKPREGIGKRDSPMVPPQTLDLDLWRGPAAADPIMRPRLHYDWHWDYNTGNGDIGNQGPHELDLARWALGDPMSLPQTVECAGGRFWDDAGNTPNVLLARFQYGEAELIAEAVNLKIPPYKGMNVGLVITCENAEFRGGRGGGTVYDPQGNAIESWEGNGNGHYPLFIQALRENDASILTSDVESAAYSAALAHQANIAFRIGQSAPLEQVRSGYADHADLTEALARFRDAMDQAGVPADAPWTLGPRLSFDSAAMRFTGALAEPANALLSREYRAGFVVPDEV